MVSGATRIAGILAVLVGFLMTSTGIGAIIGIPLMIIGFILFIPELTVPIIVIGIILLILFLIK